jgi:hypothetical protein
MSSALVHVSHLDIDDPGVVSSIQKHVADGCPLAPLVEAVTPEYEPEDRPRIIAAMVEKAREVIAHQNEHAAQLQEKFPEITERAKRGRPKSEEKAAREAVARAEKVSERTIRNEMAKLAPPAEKLVEPAPKPVPVERDMERVAVLVESIIEEADRMLVRALAEPGSPVGCTWRAGIRNVVEDLRAMPVRIRTQVQSLLSDRNKLRRTDLEVKPQAPEKLKLGDRRREQGDETRYRMTRGGVETTLVVPAEGPVRYEGPKRGLGGRKLQVELPEGEPAPEGDDPKRGAW